MDPPPAASQPANAQIAALVGYLADHWRAPEDYILDQFAAHDVVLLGEDHAIRHNLLLVHGLIPRLHAAGVTNLGMEFGAAEDQPRLDRLVTGPAYDANLARQLMFNYNVGWPYVEYMDVYRRAWEFNQTRPAGAPPFRVVNLSYRYDWRPLQGPRAPAVMRQVFPHGAVDVYRAGVVQREVLDHGQKMLALTGTVHAFSKYRYPEYDAWAPTFLALRDMTLGNLLERQAPGRVRTVLLHGPWPAPDLRRQVRPLGGLLDAVMAAFADQRVGFDTAGSPFAALPDAGSYYATGYPDFTLATLADGYIYERPFAAYEGCAVDPAFLTAANWPQARAQVPDPDWHGRPADLAAYLARIHAYVDMPRRLADVL